MTFFGKNKKTNEKNKMLSDEIIKSSEDNEKEKEDDNDSFYGEMKKEEAFFNILSEKSLNMFDNMEIGSGSTGHMILNNKDYNLNIEASYDCKRKDESEIEANINIKFHNQALSDNEMNNIAKDKLNDFDIKDNNVFSKVKGIMISDDGTKFLKF